MLAWFVLKGDSVPFQRMWMCCGGAWENTRKELQKGAGKAEQALPPPRAWRLSPSCCPFCHASPFTLPLFPDHGTVNILCLQSGKINRSRSTIFQKPLWCEHLGYSCIYLLLFFIYCFYTRISVVKTKQELSLKRRDIFLKIANEVISSCVPKLYCKEM